MMEANMDQLPKRLPIWPGSPKADQMRAHVVQQYGPDCAIAAAATITGVSYERAAYVAFSLREEGLGGMYMEKSVVLLRRLTDVPWRLEKRRWRRRRLRDTTFPDEFVFASIAHPWGRSAHAIVARTCWVYDGSPDKPVKAQEHPRGNWYVRGWIVREF